MRRKARRRNKGAESVRFCRPQITKGTLLAGGFVTVERLWFYLWVGVGSASKVVAQQQVLAEEEGFDPSRRFPAYTLSRRAPSTTRPPLREGRTIAGRMGSARPRWRRPSYCRQRAYLVAIRSSQRRQANHAA